MRQCEICRKKVGKISVVQINRFVTIQVCDACLNSKGFLEDSDKIINVVTDESESEEDMVVIRKITIDPHNCSREEYAELIRYLENNHWDYRKEEK